MELSCPKCQGTMRQYERNGVLIDQCTDCRGVFLDRGELEKLIDAEAQWADTQSRQPPPPQQHAQPGYRVEGYRDQYYKRNKKKSFLDELLG